MEIVVAQFMHRAAETIDSCDFLEEMRCARTVHACGLLAADAACCMVCCSRCGGSWGRERSFVVAAAPEGLCDVATELERMQQTCFWQMLAASVMPLTCCGCCFCCCGAGIYPLRAYIGSQLGRIAPAIEKLASDSK